MRFMTKLLPDVIITQTPTALTYVCAMAPMYVKRRLQRHARAAALHVSNQS